MSGSHESLHIAVMICTAMVNTYTDTQTDSLASTEQNKYKLEKMTISAALPLEAACPASRSRL